MDDDKKKQYELVINVRFTANTEEDALSFKWDLSKYAQDKSYVEILEIMSDFNN